MNNKYIVFFILAVIVIVFLWNKNEHLDATSLSNEAIQSIASVYNKDNLTATNINATGNLNVRGNLITPILVGDTDTHLDNIVSTFKKSDPNYTAKQVIIVSPDPNSKTATLFYLIKINNKIRIATDQKSFGVITFIAGLDKDIPN